MKIALVHDQLYEFGGAERVFIALKKIFPKAHIYTALINKKMLDKYAPDYTKWQIYTSWASKIPFYSKLYSPLRFLLPWIWESIDLSGYDTVISSSGWFMSKGIITKPETTHICYLHHPPKALYYYETATEWKKYLAIRIYAYFVNHFLRMWDFIASQRPNYFIANSFETKRRIKKFYRRNSRVIYPPVNIPDKIKDINSGSANKRYYITLSRLAKAKHIDLLVRASTEYKFNLKVIGTGRDEEYLRSIAGTTVEFIGYVSDRDFESIFAGAKAFLFASKDEEFGIAPIEAMGWGIPTIALASGGPKETIKNGLNGYLFNDLSTRSLYEKIQKLEQLSDEDYIEMRKSARREAEKYSFERFAVEIKRFINKKHSIRTE